MEQAGLTLYQAQLGVDEKYSGFGDSAIRQTLLLWADEGLPRVEMGHKQAALFACTSMTRECADTLEMPWAMFVVSIPNGMIRLPFSKRADDGSSVIESAEVGHVFVGKGVQTATGECVGKSLMLTFVPTERRYSPFSQVQWEGLGGWQETAQRVDKLRAFDGVGEATNVTECLLEKMRDHTADMQMLAQIVASVVAELNEHHPAPPLRRSGWSRGPSFPRENGEVKPYVVKMTTPVEVDCRPEIAEVRKRWNGAGKHGKMSVRCRVMAHWKMQRCGERGQERRRIRVQAHWRGDASLPVAVRPHVMKGAE
jgi:hypothetical protein